jgi:hypothetical protein
MVLWSPCQFVVIFNVVLFGVFELLFGTGVGDVDAFQGGVVHRPQGLATGDEVDVLHADVVTVVDLDAVGQGL